MAHHHTLRLALHGTALAMEAAGTFFIFFDTVRLNGMVRILGFASFNGEPEKFKAWYYHSAGLGFTLLFVGILLAACVLWIEHFAHVRSLRTPSGSGMPASAAVPQIRQSPAKTDYPQDISTEEAELKFERLLIDGIGALMGGQISPMPVPVVARVMSPSDVLIKIYNLEGEVRYSHWRWGYSKSIGNADRCKWHPLNVPIPEPKQLIFDHSFDVHKETFRDDIVGVPFTYRAA